MLVKHMPPEERAIPHQGGCYMSFRCLSDDELEEAETAAVKEYALRYGGETLDALQAVAGFGGTPQGKENGEAEKSDLVKEAERLAAAQPADPLTGLHVGTLIRYGLVSWRGKGVVHYDDIPCDDETKIELDRHTRRWAARQIVELSVIVEGEASSSGDGIAESDMAAIHRGDYAASGQPS